MQRGYPFIHKTKRYKPEKLSGMPKTRRQYKPLTPRTDFPTLPLPNPPTPLNYQSHQFPLSPTRSRLPKYPILPGMAHPHARPVPTPILWDTLFIVGATSRSVQLSFIGCNGRKIFFSAFRALFTPSVRVPIGSRGHFPSPLSYNILP